MSVVDWEDPNLLEIVSKASYISWFATGSPPWDTVKEEHINSAKFILATMEDYLTLKRPYESDSSEKETDEELLKEID